MTVVSDAAKVDDMTDVLPFDSPLPYGAHYDLAAESLVVRWLPAEQTREDVMNEDPLLSGLTISHTPQAAGASAGRACSRHEAAARYLLTV